MSLDSPSCRRVEDARWVYLVRTFSLIGWQRMGSNKHAVDVADFALQLGKSPRPGGHPSGTRVYTEKQLPTKCTFHLSVHGIVWQGPTFPQPL